MPGTIGRMRMAETVQIGSGITVNRTLSLDQTIDAYSLAESLCDDRWISSAIERFPGMLLLITRGRLEIRWVGTDPCVEERDFIAALIQQARSEYGVDDLFDEVPALRSIVISVKGTTVGNGKTDTVEALLQEND